MTLRVGLLSTARINDAIIAGAAASGKVEIVAVSSRSQERADTYAAEKGIPTAYGSYDELLASDVEAVYIALPNAFHVEWAHEALAAGKHVLVEKPLTRKPEEVDPLFDAAERAGLVVQEAYAWRHAPQTRRLLEIVASGALGELRLLRSSFSFPLEDAGDVRLQLALGGGSLLDLGCYCLGQQRLIAGEPTRVQATRRVGAGGVDVSFAASVTFADDVLGVFDCSFEQPLQKRLEIVGSEGVLRSLDPTLCSHPVLELERDFAVEEIATETPDVYGCQWDGFVRAIAGERTDLLGRADTFAQARALDALLRAAETGAAVSL